MEGALWSRELIESATNPDLPPGVIEIDGWRYPLIEFPDDFPDDE